MSVIIEIISLVAGLFVIGGVNLQGACNNQLLQTLQLKGLKSPADATDMKICKVSKEDNCCSEMDEIKILKAWNSYSQPKINKYSEDAITSYNKILQLDPFVRGLNETQIRYYYSRIKWHHKKQKDCFNGQYVMDQANYALIAGSRSLMDNFMKNLTRQIVNATIANNTKKIVVSAKIKSVFWVQVASDLEIRRKLFYGLGTFAQNETIAQVADLFATSLSRLDSKFLNIKNKTADQSDKDFLLTRLDIVNNLNTVLNALNATYFSQVLQSRATDFHLAKIENYFRTVLPASRIYNDLVNITDVNSTSLAQYIIDDIRGDPIVKRYLAWFLMPNDDKSFFTVYNYLVSRIYRVVSERVLSSKNPSMKNATNYQTMGLFMEYLNNNTLSKVLAQSYADIANHVITILYITDAMASPSYKPVSASLSRAAVFFEVNKSFFQGSLLNITVTGTTPANISKWDSSMFLKGTISAITKINDNLKNIGEQLTLTPTAANLTTFLNAFRQLNREKIEYAEFQGDQKKVCATVIKHSVIREAVFNKRKFAYCSNIVSEFKNQTIDSILEPLKTIKSQLDQILTMKRSFYCAACSKSSMKYINVAGTSIITSFKSCTDFFSSFRNYITWKTVTFENYLSKLFQYLRCFETDGDSKIALPYNYPWLENANLIDLASQCSNMKDETEAAACADLCSKIDPVNYSSFFEGDRVAINKIYNYILNVVRSYGIRYGPIGKGGDAAPRGRRLAETDDAFSIDSEQKKLKARRLEASPAPVAPAAPAGGEAAKTGDAPKTGAAAPNAASSNSTSNKTDAASSGGDPTKSRVALIAYLTKNINDLKTYTRPSHYNHDEASQR